MDRFIQYFKDNITLFYVTIIILAVLIVAVIFIFLARKALHKKQAQQKVIEDLTRALVEKPAVPNDSLFLDPQMNQTTMDDAKNSATEDQTEDENIVESEEKSADKPIIAQSNEKAQAEESNDAVTVDNEKNVEKKKTDSNAKLQQAAEEKLKLKYTGKWQIYTENGKYGANLVASNGEILLRSELYSALSGVKSGINTIKNNIEKDNFALSVDKNGNFFFKLYSSSTRLLCVSETYSSKAVCENAIESCKRFAKTAVIDVVKEEDPQ